MAASILTDCSSIQGSTTSSSSDMLTGTTAASSWCAIPTCTRMRIVRLLRPHTRRMLVTPSATPSYGFAVRGGKEFGTGFFVSNVDRNGEAEQKGLRIGDQILRINGFRIDDATHKEFCQLVTSQDRLVLKVRSVGMMPTKEKENDYLSWSMVKAPSISSTPSECSFQSSLTERSTANRHHNERVINIVLNVAPRTKLGLGICKGPEWKPGIFVQFTKEKSVAREAGLRPGDQILTVNSIDFSDVLFSEAVAVMKSSNKLDMTVHKSAGCDLFPGESSGYNSSASSVTGDQSPCWGDVKSKRLTAVREESTMAPPPPTASTSTASPSGNVSKQTIWNQALYENEQPRSRSKSNLERSSKPQNSTSITQSTNSKTNKEINKTIIKLSESGTSINNTFVANSHQTITTDTIRRNAGPKDQININEGTLTKHNQQGPIHSSSNKIPPPVPPPMAIPQPPSPQTSQNSSSSHHASNVEGPIKLGGMAATMQRYATLNNNYVAINELSSPGYSANTEAAREASSSSNIQPTTFDNSSLSSAITEELKKRKAKRQPNSNYQPSPKCDVLNNINNPSPSATIGESEQKNCKAVGTLIGTDDQHSALMNEFKQAHKRMFKNGFKENEQTQNKDRQAALMRTTIMDDPTTYRAKGCKQNKFVNNSDAGRQEDTTTDATHIPKPPPMQLCSNNLKSKSQPPQKSVYENHVLQSRSSNGFTTVPDNNDPILRNLNKNSTANVSPSSCNRQTLRLGTVSIGEYRNNNTRKEPEKFDFISSAAKRNDSGDTTPTNESLHSELHSTLSRSKLKKTNSSHLEHQRNCPLHQQQQHTTTHHHHHHQQQQQPQQPTQHHRQQHHHNHNHNHSPQQSSSQYEYQNVNINQPSYSVSEMSRKLQKTSINGGSAAPSSHTSSSGGSTTSHASAGVGILKNGSRNSSSNNTSNKSTEKTIKFG